MIEHVPVLILIVIFLSQLSGGTHKNNEEPVTANNLNINYDLLRDQSAEACLGHDNLQDDCTEHKVST